MNLFKWSCSQFLFSWNIISNLLKVRKKNLIFTSVFPKLTQSTFWPNWIKHTVLMLMLSISIIKLSYLSKTHSPIHTHPHSNTPIPHPVTAIQTSLTHPHTHPHYHPALTRMHKMATLKTGFFSKLIQSVQFTMSMYLNRHGSGLSEFWKTNRFLRYPFCFIIRYFFPFFLSFYV